MQLVIENPQPWQRADSDTDASWAAFLVFRELEPGQRSASRVAEILGKSISLVNQWSSKHSWHSRVCEYDRWLDTRQIERAEERRNQVESLGFSDGMRLHTIWEKQLEALEEEVDPLKLQRLAEVRRSIDGLLRLSVKMPQRYSAQKIDVTKSDFSLEAFVKSRLSLIGKENE